MCVGEGGAAHSCSGQPLKSPTSKVTDMHMALTELRAGRRCYEHVQSWWNIVW